MTTKEKKGTTFCTLDDLCFPVEFIDNPNRTNREHSKIVRGIVKKKVPFLSKDEMMKIIIHLSTDEAIEILESFPVPKIINSKIDLNYCSPRYELIPNELIFPKVEEILNDNNIAFSVVYSHTNYGRFYGSYTIEDKRFSYKMEGTNDVIKFIWNFQHSYNGLTKYRGIAGFYRLVCSNGLVVPIEELNDYNLIVQGKHTSSILHSLEQFSDILVKVVTDIEKVKTSIVGKYEILGDRWRTKPETRIEEVLKACKISSIDNSKFNTLNEIMNSITSEANNVGLGYNGKINDWLIYNGINRYLHDDNRNIAAPEKRRETDSKVLEYMLKYE
ncbi:MAG: DUF932 domain-containing protein [Bacteroidales bacterium]|jgi:hypothetical protein|nr:DUF932 domain-containing protein [Bacteroidales bacterium]